MQSPTKSSHTADSSTATHLPLPTLLSQALVAFTIEFDNEFEHQMPHRTTISSKSTKSASTTPFGPWLVSLVMYANFMQFIPDDGIPTGELQRLTRMTKPALDSRLERLSRWWGYLQVKRNPTDTRSDWLVLPTPAGQRAIDIWRPLFATIESRWQTRFGKQEIDALRKSLSAIATQLDSNLPDYLPVLGYGLFSRDSAPKETSPTPRDANQTRKLPLSALLSQLLYTFAIDFETDSPLSLAISANALRLITEQGVPIRDLPRLAGVSREAIKTSLSYLEKHGYLTIAPDPTNTRTKLARLTPIGRAAQDTYHQRLTLIEEQWQARFGNDAIRNVRKSLEHLVAESPYQPTTHEPSASESVNEHSPLLRGLEPPPNGWRASIPTPQTLPHYPMVLHRGGFPDGA